MAAPDTPGSDKKGVTLAAPQRTVEASPMGMPLFYRGLLCALAECRGEFVLEGEQFHAAFRTMLESAVEKKLAVPAADLLQNFDPVFGVSPEALEMILEGERDFLIVLNPRLCIAQFKICREEAARELEHLPSPVLFRELATVLHERLSDAVPRPGLDERRWGEPSQRSSNISSSST